MQKLLPTRFILAFAAFMASFTISNGQCSLSLTCQDITVSVDGDGQREVWASSVGQTSIVNGNLLDMTIDNDRFSCNDLGPNTVLITAVAQCPDGSSSVETCSATVTVIDDLAPTIFCPADRTLSLGPGQCGDFNTQRVPDIVDNCGATVTVDSAPTGFIDLVCNTDCNGPAESLATTYSYTAEDASGNTAVCSYTVTLRENVRAANSLSCNDQVNVTANPNCEVELTAQMLLQGSYGCFTCFDVDLEEQHTTESLSEFIMTVTDPCSGVSCHGRVIVEDKTDPAIICNDCQDPDVSDPNCIFNCTELPLFTEVDRNSGVIGFREQVIDDLIPSDPDDFLRDNVTEACGAPMSAVFTDEVIQSPDCSSSIMRRTWTVNFSRPDGSQGTLSCQSFYAFELLAVSRDEAPFSEPLPGVFIPFTEDDPDQGIVVENILLMPKKVVNIPQCGVGIDPASVAAFFDNPLTEDQDTDGDGDDPDEFDVDGVIENNEGIWYAYPHYYIDGHRFDGNAQSAMGGVCNYNIDFTDSFLEPCAPGCSGNDKVLRTWNILDWCANEFFTFEQVINIADQIAPRLEVSPIFASVDPWECEANVLLPAPDHLDDPCDNGLTYSIGFVERALEVTGNAEDGFVVHNVPSGQTTVQYVAEDCCGNRRSVYTTITIEDVTPPIPVILQDIVVEMTGVVNPGQNDVFGTAKLFVEDVDLGSYDSCTDVIVDMRRSPLCDEEDAEWGPSVSFCCEDLAGSDSASVPIEVRVRDWADNETFISTTVLVQDKAGGVGTCPLDIVISCIDDIWNFDVTGGTPRSFTTCEEATSAVDTLEVFENTEPNRKNINDGGPSLGIYFGRVVPAFTPSCGFGAWERNFGNCVQWIILEPQSGVTIDDRGTATLSDDLYVFDSGFDPSSISFPADIEVDCDGYDSGEPTWTEVECNLVGFTLETEDFLFEADACIKTINTWTVIDWCAFDPSDPDLNDVDELPAPGQELDPFIHDTGEVEGRYQHAQVIKILDTEAPQIIGEELQSIAIDQDCTSKGIQVSIVGMDEGLCSSEWLSWEVTLDLFADWTIDQTFSSNVSPILPNGEPNPSYLPKSTNGDPISINIPDGVEGSKEQHRVEWQLSDGCGNFASKTTYFTLEDQKAPTPYCLNLSTASMVNGEVELWAVDFDVASFDNCTNQDELQYTFTNVPPPPRCDDEYDSNTQSIWYNGTFWFFDSSEVDDSEQECGVTGAGEYMNLEDYGGDIHRWEPATRSAGKIFTMEDVGTGDNIDVPIYVWDGCQNVDFCTVNLRIINNPESHGLVAGRVVTAEGDRVTDVVAQIDADLEGYPKQIMTNDLGVFVFEFNDMANDYIVSASKDGDDGNGVSTVDLVIIQRHILGIQHLDNPYDQIAADINGDNRINGIDLVELRKLILGIYTELPQANSWRMVDALQNLSMDPWIYSESRMIANLSEDMVNEDFIGVKVGDVNNDKVLVKGTADPQLRSVTIHSEGERLSDNLTEYTFSTEELLAGYQFTLELGDNELVSVSGLGEDRYAIHGDKLTVSENLTEQKSGELMRVQLRKTEAADASPIRLSNAITQTEAYTGSSLQKVALRLSSGDAAFSLEQNIPNPFRNQTVISYVLPESSPATLTLTDVTGKVLDVMSLEGEKGLNEVTVDSQSLPIGVVYYRLEAGSMSQTKHMVILD